MKHLQRSTVKTVKHLFISAVFGLSALTAFAAAPSISNQPVSAVVGLGQAASLSVTNAGAPVGYQWLKDGVILTGQTNSTLTYASFQFTNSGSYNVVITNADGMAISFPASLSISNAPLQAWGYNGAGELGNGTTDSTNLPVLVNGGGLMTASLAKQSLASHSLAIALLPASAMTVLGTNGAIIASGDTASAAKGTDFGHRLVGASWTNTLSITNTGDATLTISGVTTSGTGSASFQCSAMPSSIPVGAVSNFTVAFNPAAAGSFTATLSITNDSPTTPYVVNLSGSACGLSTNSGPYAGGNTITITNGNFGNITNVLVGGVRAQIVACGANWVTIILPTAGSAGVKDIVVQTSDNGDITLPGAYTVNSAGVIYDNVPTGWSPVAGLPIGLKYFAAVTYSNAIYTLGGEDAGNQAVTNVFKFDGTNWTSVAGLSVSNYNQGADVYSGAVYSVGGGGGPGLSQWGMTNAYRYNGMSWAEVAGLPKGDTNIGFFSQAVKSFGGYLYSMGGYYDASGPQTNVYRYNGALWQEVVGLPDKSMNASAVVLGSNLYYMGGYNLVSVLTNVYRFDGATWSPVTGLPVAREQMACMQWENAIYVAGGYGTDGMETTNVYRFDGTNWQEMAGLPREFSEGAGAVLNDRMYVLGGRDAGGYATTNVYRYEQGSVGVSPTSGSVTGGYQVVISGTNLCDGTIGDVTSVTLCGVAATVTDVTGSTQIVVTAGAAAVAGLGNVAVYSTSYGITIKSNVFTYIGPVLSVLGTNGVAIASGEVASAGKGTDFGTFTLGTAAVTHTFAITNGGNQTLTISGMATNGSPLFQCSSIPVSIAQGTASNFSVVFNPNVVGVATASVAIANNSATTPYVLNLRGVVESVPTPNGWLAIQVTPASGTWRLNAPAGYTGPTSGTGNLAAVSAVTGAYDIAWGSMTGYTIPSNQSQFVTGGNTTLFTGAYLLISTNIGTPRGVSATEGTYTNMIRVTWQGVAGATGYEVWRSQTNDADTAGRIADIAESSALRLPFVGPQLADGHPNSQADGDEQARALRDAGLLPTAFSLQSTAYYYDDYAINPINAYYYWIRAKTAMLISPMSYVGMGYAALDPQQATGIADIAVSDLVFLPVNVTNLSSAGTVSCRLANLGPNALNAAGVAFDFYMSTNTAAIIWIGSVQSNMTLNAGREELIILTPSAKQGLTVRADRSGVQQVKVVARHLSTFNDPNLANNTNNAAGLVRIKTSGVNSPGRSLNDYDGDGKSDACLYQSALGRWYAELSGDRYYADPWIGDVGMGWSPVAGDYDGDGITDVAAYEPSSGQWLVRFSSSGLLGDCWFGGTAFTAAPCDFDGDSMTDPLVYREADGYWLGAASTKQYALYDIFLGETGYQSVRADYDGDGAADPAVYNRTTGLWAIGLSGNEYQVVTGTFGGSGYLPATADYDGDGLADPAIYSPGTAHWQVLFSGSLATQGCYTWGDAVLVTIGGIPVPADYDGDGKADLAVYHQDTGLWELYPSTQGYQLVWGLFGGPAYQPVTE